MSEQTILCDKEGKLCLSGMNSPNSGNVMISGKPVCDDEWDLKEKLSIPGFGYVIEVIVFVGFRASENNAHLSNFCQPRLHNAHLNI